VTAAELFRGLVQAHKSGRPRGVTSVCSAHLLVLESAVAQARDSGLPLLVESTANQVNQFGGYTGMRPADFAALLRGLAAAGGLDPAQVFLGGDHAGPYPWRAEPAERAMDKARGLVAESVRAGYTKLHLDASMPLAGDRPDPERGLDPAVIARREAELASAAEAAHQE
jgi:D-tagatose-1,6-bisphosphate aldolase subunit GatZ/KbaZ